MCESLVCKADDGRTKVQKRFEIPTDVDVIREFGET
jgi:hypothetical protein